MITTMTAMQLCGPPTNAAARAFACGANHNLQVGYDTNVGSAPTAVEGASANVTLRSGYHICTDDTNPGTNFITVWTMVFDQAGDGYAQSGSMYRYGYGACPKFWAETAQHGAFTDFYAGGCDPQDGTIERFRQEMVYVSGAYHVRSYVGTTIVHQTLFNPFTEWTQPFGVAFNGEAYYSPNDIPGGDTQREDYSGMSVQRFSDNAWVTACSNVILGRRNENPGNWSAQAQSCSHTQIWTTSN